ncbi:MAG: hypothetical protein ACKVVT_04785 [Dehalococcoidia bacterium]
MSETSSVQAGHVGVTVLEGATSEALTAVADSWFEAHPDARVHSIDLQASPVPGGPLYLLVVHDRIKRGGRNGSLGPMLAGLRRYS